MAVRSGALDGLQPEVLPFQPDRVTIHNARVALLAAHRELYRHSGRRSLLSRSRSSSEVLAPVAARPRDQPKSTNGAEGKDDDGTGRAAIAP